MSIVEARQLSVVSPSVAICEPSSWCIADRLQDAIECITCIQGLTISKDDAFVGSPTRIWRRTRSCAGGWAR